MASAFSHAFAAATFAKIFDERPPARLYLLAAFCAVIPDVDVIGFRYGIRYSSVWGHRGFTHSLLFAFLLACLVIIILFRNISGRRRATLILFFFIATASHGLLDALTDGGLGVAFFAPFSNARYFFPFRPIAVSPISASAFFTSRGIEVLLSEFVWIWIPSLLLLGCAFLYRRWKRKSKDEGERMKE